MKIKLLAIVSVIVFLGIIQGCSTQVCGCFHPTNIEMALSYEDQQGNDLLNPEHTNALTEQNLDVYYRKDEGYEDQLYFSESLQIVQREGQNNYLLLTLSSAPFEEREASLLIDFPNAATDTLNVQAKGSKDELYAAKIWYNDALIWPNREEDINRPYVEVTKIITSN